MKIVLHGTGRKRKLSRRGVIIHWLREMESNMPKETHVVPVYDWAAGIYFLQYLENGQVLHLERFVVLKP